MMEHFMLQEIIANVMKTTMKWLCLITAQLYSV